MATPFNALKVLLDHAFDDLEQCVGSLEQQIAKDPSFSSVEVSEKTREAIERLSAFTTRLRKLV